MKRTAAFIILAAVALSILPSITHAGIIVPGQNITVSGTATFNVSKWEYRYTITDTLGLAVTPVRFILSEHGSHAGFHDEFSFLNAGGSFQYDFAVPPPFLGISAHNYFWNELVVPASGSIVVGFDDVHGPIDETWGIQARGQYVELTKSLPVPHIPEPSSLVFTLTALGFFCLRRRFTAHRRISSRR